MAKDITNIGHRDYGTSLCTPAGILIQSNTFIKCLYTCTGTMGNKQEELEICVQLQSFDIILIMEVWRDSSQNWNVEMKGYTLFRRDRPGRLSTRNTYTVSSSVLGRMISKLRVYRLE